MLNSSIGKSLLATVAAVTFAGACIIGCGDTDGGEGNDDSGLGTQYVSDGGAGGTIEIDVKEDLSVGGTSPFMVSVRDPEGLPLTYIRIFCESEHGIAIIEPSKGGVAYESTDSYGNMSGVIGGMSPGSYMFECRAPIEYNLVARVSVKIAGEIPAGFAGWPGAAGGNLGGGYTVPEDVEQGGVYISSITFTDLGETTLYIDNHFCSCVSGSGTDITTTGEPWFVNTYKLNIKNGSSQDIMITGVSYDVVGTDVGGEQSVVISIAQGGLSAYEGQLTETRDGVTGKAWAGTLTSVEDGSYNIKYTITGYYVGTGETFSESATQYIHFGNINNCEDGTTISCS